MKANPFEDSIPYGPEEAAARADQDRRAQRNGHAPHGDSADNADFADTPAWEEPARLGADLNLPTFPAEALPAWVELFVEALSTFTQTPLDLGAMLSIGALAASASRHVVVRVRRDWEEPLNAYVGVGLPSGSRKSPVFGPIMAPLETLERELVKAARRGGQDQDDGRMPQLIAEDITPEAVASLLAEQGGRLALLSDEGGPLELISRYRETPNLEVYLKGHTGTRPLRVNRKGRPPEFVERPSLTIALAVQPDVLRALGDHPTSRARRLTARFLYSLPADNVGYREVDPPEIPEAIASTYQENMLTLARSLAALADAGGQPLALELTDEAAKVAPGTHAGPGAPHEPGERRPRASQPRQGVDCQARRCHGPDRRPAAPRRARPRRLGPADRGRHDASRRQDRRVPDPARPGRVRPDERRPGRRRCPLRPRLA
jgi:Protein of unknown function (DUF3987)